MRPLFISSFFLGLLLIGSSNRVDALGSLEHGENCDPSPSQSDDNSRRCDSSRRLSCDLSTHQCRCHHENRDVFDQQSGRCETMVGKFCAPDATFPTICVDHAICNSSTNFCECEHGFETDTQGKCTGGGFHTESSNFFISSMAMFLLLISVFICT